MLQRRNRKESYRIRVDWQTDEYWNNEWKERVDIREIEQSVNVKLKSMVIWRQIKLIRRHLNALKSKRHCNKNFSFYFISAIEKIEKTFWRWIFVVLFAWDTSTGGYKNALFQPILLIDHWLLLLLTDHWLTLVSHNEILSSRFQTWTYKVKFCHFDIRPTTTIFFNDQYTLFLL